VGQGARGFQVKINLRIEPLKTEFNHAANNSPRSGSTKKITPVVWAVIVAVMVAFAVWFSAYA
jgi:hypothetical protein